MTSYSKLKNYVITPFSSFIFFKNPKLAKVSRRFLVVEGIYMNTGQICDIHRIVELKHKYKLRLFIDESVSFGSLGQHGKGITEHANISVRIYDL